MMNTDGTGSGFTPTGRLHFGVNLVGPASELSFDQLRVLAQTAERGLFSLITLDERYWLGEDPGSATTMDPAGSNDVLTLLAALAGATTKIGVAAATAPDSGDPADLASRIASLDRLSGGRAAWSLLPAWNQHTEGNQHTDEAPETGDIDSEEGRHGFIESVQGMWAAWQNPESHGTGPVETLGAFERDGELYSVGLGPIRPTGTRHGPVLIHAGDTERERAFAARHADLATTAPASLNDALDTRRDLVARSLDCGRGAHDVKIFQAATFIVAPTHSEAVEKADWIRAQLPDMVWDGQAFIGSYAGVADLLVDFVRSGAVDGFAVMPWLFPDEFADLVNHLIPELQARGIYPTNYAAGTLRGNLALTAHTGSQTSPATDTLPVVKVGDLGDVRLDLRMELIVQKK